MSETIQEVLAYIDDLLPNSLTTATKISLVNAELRKIWEHMTPIEMYEFDTVADQMLYDYPTNISIDMIIEKGVLVATSTDAVSSTTVFGEYTFRGLDEEENGNQFYDLGGQLRISPTPDNVYPARIIYQDYPTLFASTDTTVQFNIDQDYVDLIKFKVMSRVAKSGRFPNVEIANNYELDAKELERKMKVRMANKKAKTPRRRWSYKEW